MLGRSRILLAAALVVGLDGTLDSSSYRKAPVALSMPAIGLRALVRPEGIAAGSMTLPRDVGEVGWLTRSAGAGGVIGTTVIGGHLSDRHRLVLVSCTDRVVHADGRFHYTRSLVVEARLLT